MGAAQSAARNAEVGVMNRRLNPYGPVLLQQGQRAPPGVDALKKQVADLQEKVDECNSELTYLKKVHTHAGNSGGGGKKRRKGTKRVSKKRST